MADRIQTDRLDVRLSVIASSAPLPSWLEARLLRPGEETAWVRGPRYNPSWERYVTHPALFVAALVLGLVIVGMGRIATSSATETTLLLAVLAAAIVLASIFVLGISNGYFTRLVVTNTRLLILQGYEVCRSWGIDDLPPRLVRFVHPERGEQRPAVDLEAVKAMLGSASDRFTDARTILSFGKRLEQIKTQQDPRP